MVGWIQNSIYVLGFSIISYLCFMLYQKQQDITDYKAQVTQLEANNSILRSNLKNVQNSLDSVNIQYKKYRELYFVADAEIIELREKNIDLDNRNIKFNNMLENLKEELTIVETKLLENKIPSSFIDAYNDNSMLSKKANST